MKILLLAAVLAAQPAIAAEPSPRPPQRVIVFLGDSLTAGYGVKPSENYPSLIAERLKATGWRFTVENHSRAGDTSGEALVRANDRLEKPADVLVVALGHNDGVQGIAPTKVEKNLRQVVEKAYKANPRVRILIAGSRVPLEQGLYARRFNDVFRKIAWEYRTALLPYLLEDVIAVPALTLADRVHPNAAGQRLVADRVWASLEPLLRKYYPEAAPSPQ